MSRLRLGVALMVPEPLATEVQGMRRACGDHGRMAPHLTLVPPINVNRNEVSDAMSILQKAASKMRPFSLTLGPPSTFLPKNPVLYLQVGGELDALMELREAVFTEPLQRDLAWPFTPHVTICDDGEAERLEAAVIALADYQVSWNVDRVHLLHEQPHDGHRHHRWVPFLDIAFGEPIVVGRGGFELELIVSETFDTWSRAEVATWEAETNAEQAQVANNTYGGSGAQQIVLRALHHDELVGVLVGHREGNVATVKSIIVAPDQRRHGVGRHLLGAFVAAMTDAFVSQVSVWAPTNSQGEMFLRASGFTQIHELEDHRHLVRWLHPR